jgi:hypothetical protein
MTKIQVAYASPTRRGPPVIAEYTAEKAYPAGSV